MGPAPVRVLAFEPQAGWGSRELTCLSRQPRGSGCNGRQCAPPYKGVGIQSLPLKWLPRGS